MISTLFKKKPLMEVFLVEAAKEFIEKAKREKALVNVDNSEKLREAYKTLKELGLGNSENAKIIGNQLLDIEALTRTQHTQTRLIEAMMSIKRTFEGKSYLISFEKFAELLKKYNLWVGHIKDYKGVIPEGNIQDLVRVKRNLPNLSFDIKLNLPKGFRTDLDTAFITGVNYGEGSDFDYVLERYIKGGNRFIQVNRDSGNGKWYSKDIKGLGVQSRFSYVTWILGYVVGRHDLFIACPEKYLKSEGKIKVSKNPVDPIVFQYSEFGILIHTAWGKEAEDKILQEYQELNGLL